MAVEAEEEEASSLLIPSFVIQDPNKSHLPFTYKTEAVESNENIKRITIQTKFGYSGYVIINNAKDSCYKENATFKMKGQTFLAPEEGKAFNIAVDS